MPSVRTPTAVSVKPGCLRRRRALYRRSCQMVVMPNMDVGRHEIFQCTQPLAPLALEWILLEEPMAVGARNPVLARQ